MISRAQKAYVVGAGMSGLLVAHYLLEQGFSVEIFEAQNTVGGKIQTAPSPQGLMESAANALLVDQEVESVARTIGVELISKKTEAKKRYIFRKGSPRRWPLGLGATVRLFWFFIRLKARFKVEPRLGETLEAWGSRELGQEVTDFLLEPACL